MSYLAVVFANAVILTTVFALLIYEAEAVKISRSSQFNWPLASSCGPHFDDRQVLLLIRSGPIA